MKRIYTLIFSALCLLTAFTSCSEWLDVKPESEIDGSDLFATESGYKDALTGVYIRMSGSSLYGREMTFGLVDIIGDAYYSAGTTGTAYAYAKRHDYTASSVETLINYVWQRSYTGIANLNELLAQMEKADRSLFSTDNYNVIKGEALGLRAFLHFDLLRLFAPSWTVGKDENAIPYVTDYSYKTTATSTVSEAMTKILADLTEAAALLKESDPIATGRTITTADDNGYLMDRQYHFNYYAVKATMARAYLWMDDTANAAKCAQEVIDCGKFPWTDVSAIATGTEENIDRTFTSEQVFALQIDDLDDYVLGKTYGTTKYYANLVWYSYGYTAIFPSATHGTDWRKVYLFSNVNTQSSYYYTSKKLWQEGMDEDLVKRMPIIRLPEMYLILAQCQMDKAAEYLTVMREHRGVSAPVTLTAEEDLLNEINKEYIREYVGEGQLFYFYKRLNMDKHLASYNFGKNSFDTSLYVLPMPEEEIEYGRRN